jgi:hypothetical protein
MSKKSKKKKHDYNEFDDNELITIRKVYSKDYPFPAIIFKKDTSIIRSQNLPKKDMRDLLDLYYSIREIISDVEEGRIKDLDGDEFLKLLCSEYQQIKHNKKNIDKIKSHLLSLQNLGIYTLFKVIEKEEG